MSNFYVKIWRGHVIPLDPRHFHLDRSWTHASVIEGDSASNCSESYDVFSFTVSVFMSYIWHVHEFCSSYLKILFIH